MLLSKRHPQNPVIFFPGLMASEMPFHHFWIVPSTLKSFKEIIEMNFKRCMRNSFLFPVDQTTLALSKALGSICWLCDGLVLSAWLWCPFCCLSSLFLCWRNANFPLPSSISPLHLKKMLRSSLLEILESLPVNTGEAVKQNEGYLAEAPWYYVPHWDC